MKTQNTDGTALDVTASLEDYLEAIYVLQKNGGEVRLTDVANELNISKPSVNRAVNTLKTQGLVEHEHYGLLNLTESGRSIAEDVLNRHKTLKKFLSQLLGVEEARAEKEACLIEHNVSTDTIRRLGNFMEDLNK